MKLEVHNKPKHMNIQSRNYFKLHVHVGVRLFAWNCREFLIVVLLNPYPW